ncbi:syntaxin-51-like [Amaranthus tricolor]|nr:syntaxin-51-like [Amaranthus tricolor]XP_057548358.1 syntaxin-51-like [Amaranthus tricolor]
MANTLNSHSAAYRDRLLGPDLKSDDVMKRASNMDNQGIVGFQRQIMREQDEGLEQLEETVISTKHIALAVNEELNLHTRLLDTLDDHVESTNSRLQRIQKKLAIFNKRTKGGCTCLLLLVVLIVFLILVVLALIKYV